MIVVDLKTTKTYKRELAALVFIWCVYLSIWGDLEALRIVAAPSFTFMALAFGMDWFGKSKLGEK